MNFEYAFVIIGLLIKMVHCEDHYNGYALTFILPAAYNECFHHAFEKGQSFYLEFQVISGGEADINFSIENPDGVIIEEYRKTGEENVAVGDTMDGEYVFCFDNSFSRFTAKTVFFELIHEGIPIELTKDAPDPKAAELVEEAMARMDIVDVSLSKIWNSFGRIQYLQSMFRAYEARDRWLLEFKFSRINFWSTINIFVMLSVFLLQVFTVKRMLTVSTKR